MICGEHVLDEEAKGLMIDEWFRTEIILRTYITDRSVSLKDRLMIYLRTPPQYYHYTEDRPAMPLFTRDYGEVNWEKDFGKRHGSAVDLRNICKELMFGSRESLPGATWTEEMKLAFILDCLNSGVHEFEYKESIYL